MEGKGTEKQPEMFMIYRNVIAATIVVTVCILAGSNAMAQRHGGFSGGGFRGGGGFGRGGLNSGAFRGGFNGHGFRGDRVQLRADVRPRIDRGPGRGRDREHSQAQE